MSDPHIIGGRYTLMEIARTDSAGVCYTASDAETGSTVTVYALNAGADRPAVSPNLCALDHPNILRVLDIIDTDDCRYIVSEHSDASTLRNLLTEQPQLSLMLAVEIAQAISSALIYAHEQGVIHGRLRPLFVLLPPDDALRLGGFGWHVQDSYSSPEVWQNQELSVQSDVWSLGVMLYEMLAGIHPFEAGEETSQRILQAPAPDILSFRPDVPHPLASLVNRMLAKDPEKRIRSMQHVNMELGMIAQMKVVLGDAVKPADPGESTEVLLRPKEFKPPENTKGVTMLRPLQQVMEEFEVIPPPEPPPPAMPEPGTVNIRPRLDLAAAPPPVARPVPPPEPEARHRWRLWVILAVLALIAAIVANALLGGGSAGEGGKPESRAAWVVQSRDIVCDSCHKYL